VGLVLQITLQGTIMLHLMKRALQSLFLIAFGCWLIHLGFEGDLINGIVPAHWLGFVAVAAGVVSIFLIGPDPPAPPEQKDHPSEE
jgi:hypothetical protein